MFSLGQTSELMTNILTYIQDSFGSGKSLPWQHSSSEMQAGYLFLLIPAGLICEEQNFLSVHEERDSSLYMAQVSGKFISGAAPVCRCLCGRHPTHQSAKDGQFAPMFGCEHAMLVLGDVSLSMSCSLQKCGAGKSNHICLRRYRPS